MAKIIIFFILKIFPNSHPDLKKLLLHIPATWLPQTWTAAAVHLGPF
jgi:hypothetical protein